MASSVILRKQKRNILDPIKMDTEIIVTDQDIMRLNKELLEQNKRVTLQNEKMSLDEHSAKMNLFELQKMKLIQELRADTEAVVLSSVEQFHKLFGHPVLDSPTIPPEDRWKLRIKLLREEVDELEQAFKDGDLFEVADAEADIMYVLGGTILETGMQKKFPAIFNEVQRSNLSKACSTEGEAKETVKKYAEDAVETSYMLKEGMFIVTRDVDNKAMKSVNYSPAKLKPILDI